jgi:endonuclease/exonuclease/phosphatase (EEP) superfamily protein YafD
LEAKVQTPEGPLTFCSVHLDHRKPEDDRLASIDAIKRMFVVHFHPTIVAGDFNAKPDSETYKKMMEGFYDSWRSKRGGFTIPSDKPRSRIDYVWSRGWLAPRTKRVLKSDASDHLPLILDLQFMNKIVDYFTQEDPFTKAYEFKKSTH